MPTGAEHALAAEQHEAVISVPEQLLKQSYRHPLIHSDTYPSTFHNVHTSHHSVNLDGERRTARAALFGQGVIEDPERGSDELGVEVDRGASDVL